MKELITRRADYNLGGEKPLLLAILNARTALVDYFLDIGNKKLTESITIFVLDAYSLSTVGVDPVLTNSRGDNAVLCACDTSNIELVQKFLALGCDPVWHCENFETKTPYYARKQLSLYSVRHRMRSVTRA